MPCSSRNHNRNHNRIARLTYIEVVTLGLCEFEDHLLPLPFSAKQCLKDRLRNTVLLE